jgi:hypothetical protein
MMRARSSTAWRRKAWNAALIGLAALVVGTSGASAGPPVEPAVLDVPEVGEHGGSLRMLVSNTRDTRLLVVYGYARLVAYDTELNLVPDILEDI